VIDWRAGCCFLIALGVACDEDARPASTAVDAGRTPQRPLEARMRVAAAQFHPRAPSSASTHDAPDAGVPDAGVLTPVDPVVARGEYLVRHVAGCMECHTPRLASGAFDETKLLSGVEDLADVEPDDDARG
jgi:mono/diheme cytochrome c family protein